MFFVSQNIGKTTKAIDSKATIEEKTTTSTYLSENTKELTVFNIPTKESLNSKNIEQNFKKTQEIEYKAENIKALSITGNAQLTSEAGLIRVILVDSEKHEYLVYETSSLLNGNSKEIKFENVCEETCVFDKPLTVASIKIQVEDAVLTLSSVNTLPEDKSLTEVKDITSYKQQVLKSQNQAKIEKYNSAQKSWIAGETSVSKLSYDEKKKLFSNPDGTPVEYLPNLQGFLYYKGGIFYLKDTKEQQAKAQDNITPYTPPQIGPENIIVPDSWDWRNVHGQNWMTPVKNQGGVYTCGIFAEVGTFESQINLYYNQHLNIDLSEQIVVDCSSNDFPGYPGSLQTCTNSNGIKSDFCRFAIHGLPDESCDPYVERYPGSEQYCSLNYICNNWDSRTWKNNSATQIHTFDEHTKKLLLIKKGVLNSFIPAWEHSMVLIGYQNYKSNWKTIESCESEFGLNNGFCSNTGCISKQCFDINAIMSVCNNFIDYPQNTQYGILNNYKCLFSNTYGTYRWQYIGQTASNDINATYTSCVNGEIISEPFNPTIGQQECGTESFPDGYLLELKQFSPEQGDTYWIFKNSWGEDWGDNGYAYVALSNFNIVVNGILSDDPTITTDNFPQYPFTPPIDTSYWPADFDNSINCVDEDGDKYCNWGISETKPSTCPSFCKAKKDCDDSNPDLLGFKSETDLRCRYKYEIQQ